MNIDETPGFFANLFTIGIAMARWTDRTNKAIGQGGAGFWFAWFLAPFAYYGLAQRINGVQSQRGSNKRMSPVMCFLFVGWPFIGSRKRLGRATDELRNTVRIQQHQAA